MTHAKISRVELAMGAIDWPLLRQQKAHLVAAQEEAGKTRGAEARESAFEGLLNFLDALQDSAAKDVGEAEVFSYPTGTRVRLLHMSEDDQYDEAYPLAAGVEGEVYDDPEGLDGEGLAVRWELPAGSTNWAVPVYCVEKVV